MHTSCRHDDPIGRVPVKRGRESSYFCGDCRADANTLDNRRSRGTLQPVPNRQVETDTPERMKHGDLPEADVGNLYRLVWARTLQDTALFPGETFRFSQPPEKHVCI